jgi:putative oxidoreductase
MCRHYQDYAFSDVSELYDERGLPLVAVLLPLTILMKLSCGLMLIFRWRSIYAAVILALITVPTTIIFHAFSGADAASFLNQLTSFLKNVALLGGLLMVASIFLCRALPSQISRFFPAFSNTAILLSKSGK